MEKGMLSLILSLGGIYLILDELWGKKRISQFVDMLNLPRIPLLEKKENISIDKNAPKQHLINGSYPSKGGSGALEPVNPSYPLGGYR